jgi:hypothetical protein
VIVGVDFSTKALHCCFAADSVPQIARLEIASAETEVQASLVYELLGGLLRTLEERYEQGPGLLVIERPWAGSNARSVVKLGQVQGAVMATAYAHGWVVREEDPSAIRKAVVGVGTAKGKGAIKQIVRDWVKMVYKMDLSEDAADAVVIWSYGAVLQKPRPRGLGA